MRSLSSTVVVIAALAIAMSSCKDRSNGANLGNNVLASDQYLAASIGSDSLTIEDGVSGFVNSAGSGGGVVDTNGNYLQREFTEYSNNADILRIYFLQLFSDTPSTQQVADMVQTGNYSYGQGTTNAFINDTVISGVAITYTKDGTTWSTEYESQSSSTFTVDSVWANTVDNASSYFVKGTFSCTLGTSTSSTQTVDNGSFSGRIIF